MKNKGKQNKFFKFFNKWTLFGVILVLGSIIITDKLSTYQIALIPYLLLKNLSCICILNYKKLWLIHLHKYQVAVKLYLLRILQLC